MNELKTRNTFSVATQSFTRLGDHQLPDSSDRKSISCL